MTREDPTENSAEFVVGRQTLKAISRRPGVSALIRYYNDKYTLIPCLESIRGIFDEIIIVHQPCDDYSEALLRSIDCGCIESLKDETIRTYHYPWHVYPPHAPSDWSEPSNLRTLANYCNYGLSKITTQHFIKIDSDQLYFNDRLLDVIQTGLRQPSNIAPFGINLFVNSDGEASLDPEALCNGWHGDTRLVDFEQDPFFVQSVRFEVLTGHSISGPRFGKPVWLHLMQIRRPERFPSHTLKLRELQHLPQIADALAAADFSDRLSAAVAAVEESKRGSLCLEGVDELFVVGNSPIDLDLRLGEEIDMHPFVVRFGEGACPEHLNTYCICIGKKTDLYCLNGYIFHPSLHLGGKRVLFTRPLEDRCNLPNGLFVTRGKRDHIASVTSNITHIPKSVFYRFKSEFKYDNPTSGLIFIYYAKVILGKRLKAANFNFSAFLQSSFQQQAVGCGHDIEKERMIFNHLMERTSLSLEHCGEIHLLRYNGNVEYPVSLTNPECSVQAIVARDIWSQLDPSSAALVAKECWKVLQVGGELEVIATDLGFVPSIMDIENAHGSDFVIKYTDKYLPEAPIYSSAIVVNHWIRSQQFCYDQDLILECLVEGGFSSFQRIDSPPDEIRIKCVKNSLGRKRIGT